MARRVRLGTVSVPAPPFSELIPLVARSDGAVRLSETARRDSGRALRLMLRTAERVLLRGNAQAIAQRNAWAAVCEDRERAADRAEAWSLLS